MQMLPNICHQKDVKNEISVAENTVQKNFKASAEDAKFRYNRTSVNFYWVLGISLWIMTLKYSEKNKFYQHRVEKPYTDVLIWKKHKHL